MQVPQSILFNVLVRFTFALVNMFAIYLLFRGHDEPGGGFIAGLATAISLILLNFALGLRKMEGVLPVDPVRIASAGLVVALTTAVAPLFFGAQFLEHFTHEFSLGIGRPIKLGTAFAFDVGVYLVVVGVTKKLIFVFAKSTHGYSSWVNEEERELTATAETPIEKTADAIGDDADVRKRGGPDGD